MSVWWWSKYSTAGRYAVRGAASVCGEGGGISLVQRDGRALAVAVAAVVLHVAGLQSTWTQLRSRVNSAILRWALLWPGLPFIPKLSVLDPDPHVGARLFPPQ